MRDESSAMSLSDSRAVTVLPAMCSARHGNPGAASTSESREVRPKYEAGRMSRYPGYCAWDSEANLRAVRPIYQLSAPSATKMRSRHHTCWRPYRPTLLAPPTPTRHPPAAIITSPPRLSRKSHRMILQEMKASRTMPCSSVSPARCVT